MANLVDIDALRAFAVVASQLNMRRAADLLHISQPPLSRKIGNLENRLGTRLFVRHSAGLELTDAGREILAIIQPLLNMQEEVQEKLDRFRERETCVVGFTTAFEQSVFEPVIAALKKFFGNQIAIKRASSVQLAGEVLKGNLLAAWVALPLFKSGLSILTLPYSEPLLAAMPEKWEISAEFELAEMNGKPFFWFSAYRNPYWYERMSMVFKELGFKPKFMDEPFEYDVLLAGIAAGAGWTLLPTSFSEIRRKGVKFIQPHDLPSLEMGMVYRCTEGEIIAQKFGNVLSMVVDKDSPDSV